MDLQMGTMSAIDAIAADNPLKLTGNTKKPAKFLGACCPNGRKAGFSTPILQTRPPGTPVGKRRATTRGGTGGGEIAAALLQVDCTSNNSGWSTYAAASLVGSI